MKEREDKIAEYRRKQPLAELRRKFNKAKGRRRSCYISQELLDLANAEFDLQRNLFVRAQANYF